MDSILSSNEELLTSGYAGSQVLSVKLDTLAESRRKKRSTDGSQSTQNATECKVGINFYNINDPQHHSYVQILAILLLLLLLLSIT